MGPQDWRGGKHRNRMKMSLIRISRTLFYGYHTALKEVSMTAAAAAALLNLLGYITGLSLYTMLLVMLLKAPRTASALGADSDKSDRLPLLTALLGLAWNLGALVDLG